MIRAAATLLFKSLEQTGAQQVPLSELAEKPQYGFTASAFSEEVGPKLVRITDLQGGRIDWEMVPYCQCPEPENYLLKPNDLLFARTGATTGKTYLVAEPRSAVFASYLIRTQPKNGIKAGYLYSFFQSENYWSQIIEEKEGSAQPNVNGQKLMTLTLPVCSPELQESISDFLEAVRGRQDGSKVSLPELPPPLTDQRRIVVWIEELAARINEARELRQQAAREVEAFVTSFHTQLSGTRTKKLGDVLRLDEDAVLVAPTGSYRQVGVKSFGEGLFPKSAIAGSETTYKTFNRLYEGAFVLSQVKGWEGAVAICSGDLAGWFVSPEYRTFRCLEGQARPGYLAPLVRTEWFWGRLGHATRGVGARRERTRPEQFLNIEIPMPGIDRQRQGEKLFAKLAAVKKLQTETVAELNALMPSILDQAFKGELRLSNIEIRQWNN